MNVQSRETAVLGVSFRMKRKALEKHLQNHGCTFLRHGGSHDVWINPTTLVSASVPRHREIKHVIVRAVCRDLDIPVPREK